MSANDGARRRPKRVGAASLDEANAQLAVISEETDRLRKMYDMFEDQEERHFRAADRLTDFCAPLAVIEQQNDWERRRQFVEDPMPNIQVVIDGEGR
jgi:hypothetical protein